MLLFVYGSLLDPKELARRAGDAALAQRVRPATLSGWRRVSLPGGRWPTLVRDSRARIPGAVVRVGGAALRRLAAYEGPLYRLQRVAVETTCGIAPAFAWIAPGGTPRHWGGSE